MKHESNSWNVCIKRDARNKVVYQFTETEIDQASNATYKFRLKCDQFYLYVKLNRLSKKEACDILCRLTKLISKVAAQKVICIQLQSDPLIDYLKSFRFVAPMKNEPGRAQAKRFIMRTEDLGRLNRQCWVDRLRQTLGAGTRGSTSNSLYAEQELLRWELLGRYENKI